MTEQLPYDAIGVAEVQFYTNALFVLDAMEKAAQVRLLKAEKLLGGRMVSLFVCGSTDDVKFAVDRAKEVGDELPDKPVKVAYCLNRPHKEIRKLLED